MLEQIHAQVSDRRHDRWRVAFANAARILRGCLGTHFRNSLTVGSLKKINNLFIKDIFHGYCLKRQSLREDHIKTPVKSILYPPVSAHSVRETSGIGRDGGDKKTVVVIFEVIPSQQWAIIRYYIGV